MTTAVVPVAGLGTRLLPATRAIPKEMLPVGGKPVVQHVVEELAAAGIERVVFVTAVGKEAIERHFAAAVADGEFGGLTFEYVVQPQQCGLGAAVLRAHAATGDEPFAIALGDAILGTRTQPRVIERLAQARAAHDGAFAVAVRDVPRALTNRFGIVCTDADADVARVTSIVEKPDPGAAPSTLAVAARYVATPAIYDALRDTPPGAHGELELTDAIARLVDAGTPVVALHIRALERHDIGTHESYAAAFLAFALTDRDHGQRLRTRTR